MASLISFNCPVCGQHIEVNEAQAGKRGRCTECNELLRIPSHHIPSIVDATPIDYAPLKSVSAADTRSRQQKALDASGKVLVPIAIVLGLVVGIPIIILVCSSVSSYFGNMGYRQAIVPVRTELVRIVSQLEAGTLYPDLLRECGELRFQLNKAASDCAGHNGFSLANEAAEGLSRATSEWGKSVSPPDLSAVGAKLIEAIKTIDKECG